MNKKYWYKLDFSKASKSLAKAISKDFHVWELLLTNSKVIKYKSKTNKKQSVLFSAPKKITKGGGLTVTKLISKMKFNFGKFTAIFAGKNLNKNFKGLKSIKIFNKKLGEISYAFNKVNSVNNVNNLVDPDKNNIVIGSKYNDQHLEGDGGQNIIDGGKGHDKIYVSGYKNIVYGGSGNDVLDVYGDSHKLYGGKGKDIFKISSNGKAKHLIADFKDKEDKIFIGSIKKLKLKNKGKDVFIYSGKDLLAKVKKAKGILSKKGKYFV
tara:strand:- start:405 stop:1202 length:798 start_codon:yes stop_codon:yes gene_type:complete